MIRIGTSGWSYEHWRGLFYPEDLPQKRWFEHYCTFFDTVELNATFYRLFPEKTFAGWQEKAPNGFKYAVKLWRWITHRKHLREVRGEVSIFCRRVAALRDSLGPILVQLPPGLRWSPELLLDFLKVLPQEFSWIFEIRRKEWLMQDCFDLLSRYGCSLAYSDYPGLDMTYEQVLGPAVYLRFHGSGRLYAGSYPDDQLQIWADRIAAWGKAGKRVWVYFNNDFGGHAIKNALTLKGMCGA